MVVAELATTRPFSWPIKPAWSVLAPVKRQGHPQELVLSVYREHGVIPKESREDNHNRTPENLDTYQLVEPGDVVFNKMKAWSGSVGVAEHRGIVSPDYMVCEVLTPDIDRRFLHYLLRSQALFSEYRRRSKGIRPSQWRLYFDELRSVELPIPDFATQRRIADMLDTETVRIDTLIEKNERVLELLSQRATALITAAVTGAVDVGQSGGPRTPFGNHVMSSLVTGLSTGLQPIRPMRYLAEVNSQSLPETHPVDAEIEYLDIGAVGHGQILLTPERMTFGAAPSRARRVVQKGDILVSTVRTYLRAVARIAEPPENLIASTGFAVLRARPDVIEPRFLFYWCLSDHFIESVVSKSTGVSYPAINASDLLAMPVFCPPLDVQRRIADMLDVEIEKMEELRSTVNRQQDLLRLRRQALITAAVTGQIEV